MNRLTVRAKYLYDGERKFFARGVSYGPFTPNSRGERYPEPDRAAADFALMRQLGVNVVRTYTPPPPWIFELAARHELRLMVGMPWPFHMAFLDSAEMTRDIRRTIGDGVHAMKQFAEVIFAYSLGNEIRSDIVRWHGPRAVNRFLRELYDLGKHADPQGLF
ncbi:MAG: glycosyl transferase, partial [Candidatus Binataceae bacterium]